MRWWDVSNSEPSAHCLPLCWPLARLVGMTSKMMTCQASSLDCSNNQGKQIGCKQYYDPKLSMYKIPKRQRHKSTQLSIGKSPPSFLKPEGSMKIDPEGLSGFWDTKLLLCYKPIPNLPGSSSGLGEAQHVSWALVICLPYLAICWQFGDGALGSALLFILQASASVKFLSHWPRLQEPA